MNLGYDFNITHRERLQLQFYNLSTTSSNLKQLNIKTIHSTTTITNSSSRTLQNIKIDITQNLNSHRPKERASTTNYEHFQ